MSSLNELQKICRRSPSNCIDLAKKIKKALEEHQLTQNALAIKLGIKRSTLANYLRLLTLPDDIQEALIQGVISMGHAKAILSAPSVEHQRSMVEQILKKGLSVRESEKVAIHKISDKMGDFQLFVNPMIEELQRKLGTRVTLTDKGVQGQLLIDYYDWEDLDRLLSLLLTS
jgi:ParB family transcriptional regulator, chromosome partitioning protein